MQRLTVPILHIAEITAQELKERKLDKVALLGCTEIGLLVKQSDTKAPLFDTTYIHAKRAALYSVSES